MGMMIASGEPLDQSGNTAMRLRRQIQRTMMQTGMSQEDVSAAAAKVMLQMQNLPVNTRLNLLPDILKFSFVEHEMKGVSGGEAAQSLVGLLHLSGAYSEEQLKKLAPEIAFASTLTPASMPQLERAASYVLPFSGQAGIDPGLMLLIAAQAEASGIMNTKSGTWFRGLIEKLGKGQRGHIGKRGKREMVGGHYMTDRQAAVELGLIGPGGEKTGLELLEHNDLAGFIQRVHSRLDKIDPKDRLAVMALALGSEQAAAGLNVLMLPGFENIGELQKKLQAFTEKSESPSFISDIMSADSLQQFLSVWQSLKVVLQDIGHVLMPVLGAGLSRFKEGLDLLHAGFEFVIPYFDKFVNWLHSIGKWMDDHLPAWMMHPGAAALDAVEGKKQGEAVKQGAKEGVREGLKEWEKKAIESGFHPASYKGKSGLGGLLNDAVYYGDDNGSLIQVSDADGDTLMIPNSGPGDIVGAPTGAAGGNPNAGGGNGVTITGGTGYNNVFVPQGRMNPIGSPTPGQASVGVTGLPMIGGGGFHTNLMHGQYGGVGQNMTTVTAGGHRFKVNAASAPYFKGFVDDLVAAGAPIHEIGGYRNTYIAGSHHISQHAYGNAIDIDQVRRNVSPRLHAWAMAHPQQFRAILNKYGIVSGGDWRGPDFGHFEWGGPGQGAIAAKPPHFTLNDIAALKSSGPVTASHSTGSPNVDAALQSGAAAAGMDVAHFKSIAAIESALDPHSNYNKRTQYKGLFQIGRSEWGEYLKHGGSGSIYNASDNAMAMAYLVNRNRADFKRRFGRDPTNDEIYLMHQQGLGFYTRGALTNMHGNLPASARPYVHTHQQFEQYWSNRVEQGARNFKDQAPVPQAGKTDDHATATIPPSHHSQPVELHNIIHLDGRPIAKNTMKYIGKHGTHPTQGPRLPDHWTTRPVAV